MTSSILTGAIATESAEPWREVVIAPGCTLSVAWPTGALRGALALVYPEALRFGLTGQAVIRGWQGMRVERSACRWRPRVTADGTVPFSKMNAGLLYLRADAVRAAVDATIAAWDAECEPPRQERAVA